MLDGALESAKTLAGVGRARAVAPLVGLLPGLDHASALNGDLGETFFGAPEVATYLHETPFLKRGVEIFDLALEIGAAAVALENRSADGLCHSWTFLLDV